MKSKIMLWAAGLALAAASVAGAARTEPRDVLCRIELDRGVLPADAPQRAVVKVTLDAPVLERDGDRPPVNLAIVLDRSGSMSGEKIEKAKEAAIEALRRLGPRDVFSLVIYDDRVETVIPAQEARNAEWMESRIRAIQPGGNTALFAGVSQGAAEVRRNLEGRYVHRIILLSDGLANVGPSSPDDLGRLGASLLKESISVTTVGVGTDYNEDLMTRLSQNSDGNTYFVENSRDLPRIFAAELGDVLSVVARSVVLKIRCLNGVRPVRIIGRDGRVTRDGVEIQLNQLYGGQQKYALVEVEVPAGAEDQVLEIASADCRYRSALTDRDRTSSSRVEARFSRREDDVRRSANVTVQEEYIRNEIAVAKDKAVEQWDAGERQQAVEDLRKKSEELKELGATYDVSVQVITEAEDLSGAASKLDAEGMSPSDRKEYRTDSYQTRNQQMSE